MIAEIVCRRCKNCQLLVAWMLLLVITTLNASCTQTSQSYSNTQYLGNIDYGFLSKISWSPDGTKIVATTYNDGKNFSRIYLFDIETQKFHRVLETTYGRVTASGWSPSGNQIIFSSHEGGSDFKSGIWLLDVDNKSSAPEFLSDGDLAAWSPDGNTLAVFKTSRKSPVWDIALYTLDLTTSDNRIVYETRGKYIYGLSWSPDGIHLTFALAQEEQIDNVNVYTLNIVSGELVMLTTSGNTSSPVWSPIGNMIAYVDEDRDGHTKLYIQESDESCSMVVPNIVNISSPAWSPDGRFIAFIGEFGGIYKLDLVKVFGEGFLDGIDC